MSEINDGKPELCPCEDPSNWTCCGVPGVLAQLDHADGTMGNPEHVERCDSCNRYPSDAVALAVLVTHLAAIGKPYVAPPTPTPETTPGATPTIPTILIVVEGGVVQGISATMPVKAIIKDWDILKQGDTIDFDPDVIDPLPEEQFNLEVHAGVLKCGHRDDGDTEHTHEASEDHLVCTCCERCVESLDSEDLCTACGGQDENAKPSNPLGSAEKWSDAIGRNPEICGDHDHSMNG